MLCLFHVSLSRASWLPTFLGINNPSIESSHHELSRRELSLPSPSIPPSAAVSPRQVLTYDRNGFAATRTVFTGWARMALPLGPGAGRDVSSASEPSQQQGQGRQAGFRVTEVQPARVGEDVPAKVAGESCVPFFLCFLNLCCFFYDSVRSCTFLKFITLRYGVSSRLRGYHSRYTGMWCPPFHCHP